MTNILALDLGTKLGWAVTDAGHLSSSGTANFSSNRFSGGGIRYLMFTKFLNDFNRRFDIVVYEEVRRHLGVDAAHAYGGYMAILTSWCETRSIPYTSVPVGTIKKFISGKGNASKEDVIEAVRTLGHSPKDDNEADAISIAYWAEKNLK